MVWRSSPILRFRLGFLLPPRPKLPQDQKGLRETRANKVHLDPGPDDPKKATRAGSATAMPEGLFNVAGKNVLITGSSRGIGLMIAEGFANAGANIYLTSRDPKASSSAADTIRSNHNCLGEIYHGPSDVSTREGCAALVADVHTVFGGRLDVLVNNAGATWGESLDHESSMNWGWDKVMDVNVKGMFYLMRECTVLLERAQRSADPGRIINVGSVGGIVPQEAPTHAYDVSKAAVHHLTKTMAADLAPRSITVNCLVPGYVPSRMSAGLNTWGVDMEKLSRSIPLGRMGNEDDMCGACIFLSSKAGAWITGTILNVDGGTVGALRIPLSSL